MLLGPIFYGGIRASMNSYWLVKDGKQTVAVITNDREQHNVVDYKYSIGGKDYHGFGPRNNDAKVGEETFTFYSLSHPSISSLRKVSFPSPRLVWACILSFVLLVIVFFTSNRKGSKPHL